MEAFIYVQKIKYLFNYGEELAYWYLRLSGFFIIRNFCCIGDRMREIEVMQIFSQLDCLESESLYG